jgi:hypothetical protein
MNAPSPPLWTWAVAGVVAAIVLGLLALDPAGRLTPYEDLNLGRLDRARTHRAPLVVILGTSKVECAVGFDPEITAQVRAAGVTADVIRVTRQAAIYQDLAPAFEPLIAARPDLVLVEEDLLYFGHTWDDMAHQKSWRARVDRALRTRLGFPRSRFNYPGPSSRPCGVAKIDPATLVGEYAQLWATRWPTTPQDRSGFTRQLDRLRANGTKVVLLQLPPSPLATKNFPPQLRASAIAALADLQASHGLSRIGPPFELPQSAYKDLGHMNAEGRQRYTEWLAPEIAALIRDD